MREVKRHSKNPIELVCVGARILPQMFTGGNIVCREHAGERNVSRLKFRCSQGAVLFGGPWEDMGSLPAGDSCITAG